MAKLTLKLQHKSCTNLANKYNYQHRIFTFKDNEIIKAVVDNPSIFG